MPAKNVHHDAVVVALKADGWAVTHDPFRLTYGLRRLFVDLGADRALGAEKDGERIAVEIQSFVGASDIDDLQHAVGQFLVYRLILAETDPDRVLYLAVSDEVYSGIFAEPVGQLVVTGVPLRLVTYDPKKRRLKQWIR